MNAADDSKLKYLMSLGLQGPVEDAEQDYWSALRLGGVPGLLTPATAAAAQAAFDTGGTAFITALKPSGGDDSPQALAQYGSTGRILLGPGRFRFNTPLRLNGGSRWRASGITFYGPNIQGAGKGVTFVETDGMALSNHDVAAIDSIAIGVSTVITSAAITAQAWLDGSANFAHIIQMPNTRTPGDAAVASVERLNGVRVFIKSLGANTYQLYHDAALTNAINSTGWGAGTVANIGNASNKAFIRRYNTVITAIPYVPAFRIAGAVTAGVGSELMGCLIEGLTFEAAANSNYPATYERQGVCLAFESDATVADTTTLQGVMLRDVHIHGYDVAVATDDLTNFGATGCNFQNNSYAMWSGYNGDITSFDQCRFGDDTVVSLSAQLQHVIVPSFSFYSPLGVRLANSQDNVRFSDCWFMGVLAVNQNLSATANVSGANGSAPFNPSSLWFVNCYFEQLRRISDSGTILFQGCSFNSFARDTNLTNNECLVGAFGGAAKARITFSQCMGVASSATAGLIPKFGYVHTRLIGTAGTENHTPDITWDNNRLGYNTATGAHIMDNGGRRIILLDNTNSSDLSQSAGRYFFEGTLQTDGKRRLTKNLVNSAAATYTPYVYDSNLHHVGPVTAATAIQNPCLTSSDAATFATSFGAAANGSGGGANFMYTPLRLMTLQFILEQDAVGGRVFSFGTDFATLPAGAAGFVNGTAVAGGLKSLIEFKWTGTKWAQMYPNQWA